MVRRDPRPASHAAIRPRRRRARSPAPSSKRAATANAATRRPRVRPVNRKTSRRAPNGRPSPRRPASRPRRAPSARRSSHVRNGRPVPSVPPNASLPNAPPPTQRMTPPRRQPCWLLVRSRQFRPPLARIQLTRQPKVMAVHRAVAAAVAVVVVVAVMTRRPRLPVRSTRRKPKRWTTKIVTIPARHQSPARQPRIPAHPPHRAKRRRRRMSGPACGRSSFVPRQYRPKPIAQPRLYPRR